MTEREQIQKELTEYTEELKYRTKHIGELKEQRDGCTGAIDNEEFRIKVCKDMMQKCEDKLKALPEDKYKPNYYDTYFCGTPDLPDYYCSSIWTNSKFDNFIFNLGIVRKTKEEAIEDGKRLYYTEMYRNMSDVTEADWEDTDKAKYYAEWVYYHNTFKLSWTHGYKLQGTTYFSTEQKCRDAINAIGEDNFKRYVLGVKEAVKEAVREVKRKAKVGEYIKVANSDNNPVNHYKNGDILYVYEQYAAAVRYEKDYTPGIRHEEYVVLEGYKPTENFIYELSYDGTTASFKILKQPEAWREKENIYIASNGISFVSRCYPELSSCDSEVRLQGDKKYDNRIDKSHLSQSEYNRIESALSEFKQWADKQSFEEGK